MTQSETPTPPLLRWAGSKRKLLPKLLPYWGDGYARYLEPFAGSAALFYAIAPQCAVLSDINADLIDTLTAVRDHPRAIYNRLAAIPRGKRSYKRLRAKNPRRLEQYDRAARFLFLNRFCFNGLYRTNALGQFNVPYSSSRTGEVPSWGQFFASARRLRSATLQAGDFVNILLTQVRAGDFVYLDPPYAVENRRIFRQYGATTFGLEDLSRLAELLVTIDKRGAKFVLSYACCAEWKQFFGTWPHRKFFVQRNISGFVEHRRRAAEMVASNIAPFPAS